jgi:hypothetical protein
MGSQPDLSPCERHERGILEHGARLAKCETDIAVMQALGGAKRGTIATWGPTVVMAALALGNLILLFRKH